MDYLAPYAEGMTREAIAGSLREMIRWRDVLAGEIVRLDADIGKGARALANLDGVTVKPSLDQLRRQLAAEPGPVDKRDRNPLGPESAGAISARP